MFCPRVSLGVCLCVCFIGGQLLFNRQIPHRGVNVSREQGELEDNPAIIIRQCRTGLQGGPSHSQGGSLWSQA